MTATLSLLIKQNNGSYTNKEITLVFPTIIPIYEEGGNFVFTTINGLVKITKHSIESLPKRTKLC